MRLEGFFDKVIVDLSGAKFAKKRTPVIADHNPSLRVGFTTEQSISNKDITAIGKSLTQNRLAKSIAADANDGFPFQTSIGADIDDAYYVDEGESARVNGKNWKGPLIVASRTRINEISVVTLGADSNTSAEIAASKKRSLLEISPMSFQTWLKANKTRFQSLGINFSKITATQKKTLREMHAAEMKAKKPVKAARRSANASDDEDEDETDDAEATRRQKNKNGKRPAKSQKTKSRLQAQREAEAAEDDRIGQIRAIGKKFKSNSEGHVTIPDSIFAKYPGLKKPKIKISNFKAAAIRSGMTPDEFEVIMMRADRPKPEKFRGGIHSKGVDLDIQGQVLSCALQMGTGGIARRKNETTGKEYGYEVEYPEQVLQAAHDLNRKSGGITLHQLMDTTIKAAKGWTFEGNRKSREFLRETFACDQKLKAAGQTFSTLSVSNVLEDSANKRLMVMYQAQQVVWPFFTKEIPLTDFKVHNVYRLDNRSRYQKLGPAGEIQHGSFSDAKYTLQADTFAVMICLERQQMMNDDLGVFNEIPDALGRLAPIAIESEFFVMLLANTGSFFHSTNGNLETGAGSDLSINGLTLAEKVFSNQVDLNGNPILIPADRLLVGTQDYVLADDLFKSDKIITGESVTRTDKNSHVGKYKPYKSPYLNNSTVKNQQSGAAISGQDTDQWYLFPNPEFLAAFHVGFVQGQRVPTLESADTDFSVLGMQWRAFHDWGLGQANPKGAVKMAGA